MPHRRNEIDYETNHPIHDAIFGGSSGFKEELADDTPPGADHDSVNLHGAAVEPERNKPMRAVGDTDSSDRQPLGNLRH